jgi:hypothetical protein
MMAKNPKVFISYSHDSPEHKQWVSELAARLRRNGVDAILDQWDLGLGDDITRFMERGIVDADRVLVICTDQYVKKANSDEGGVGYERMIVNAELVQNLGTDKFIPIIRQISGIEKTPAFLGTRVYADFTKDSQFDVECEKLIRELHDMPLIEKPPLGEHPFPSVEPDARPTEIPEEVKSASAAYTTASKLVRAGDVLGWRQLIKQIRPNVFKDLVQWRQDELDGQEPGDKEQLVQVVDKAVEIVSPLIAIALVGVESGREEFRDQKSLLDDLLNIAGWNRSGHRAWVDIPSALGYVYHGLHGSISLSTNQMDIALSLSRVKIPNPYTAKPPQVWEKSDLMGWADSFGPNCIEGWNYLANAYERERWKWLSLIFEDEQEYRTALVAYYMALNIHELASIIASGQQDVLINKRFNSMSPFRFNVPLTFMSEEQGINQRATSVLLRNPEALAELWTSLNVRREQIEISWRNWIRLFETWLMNVYEFGSHAEEICDRNVIHHQDFFEKL